LQTHSVILNSKFQKGSYTQTNKWNLASKREEEGSATDSSPLSIRGVVSQSSLSLPEFFVTTLTPRDIISHYSRNNLLLGDAFRAQIDSLMMKSRDWKKHVSLVRVQQDSHFSNFSSVNLRRKDALMQ
jgi:hypothetical protein